MQRLSLFLLLPSECCEISSQIPSSRSDSSVSLSWKLSANYVRLGLSLAHKVSDSLHLSRAVASAFNSTLREQMAWDTLELYLSEGILRQEG